MNCFKGWPSHGCGCKGGKRHIQRKDVSLIKAVEMIKNDEYPAAKMNGLRTSERDRWKETDGERGRGQWSEYLTPPPNTWASKGRLWKSYKNQHLTPPLHPHPFTCPYGHWAIILRLYKVTQCYTVKWFLISNIFNLSTSQYRSCVSREHLVHLAWSRDTQAVPPSDRCVRPAASSEGSSGHVRLMPASLPPNISSLLLSKVIQAI